MAVSGIPQNYNLQTANIQNFLSWDISVGATSYNIYRSTTGILPFALYATIISNSYLDTAVVAGTQYYYTVTAVNSDGEGAATSSQSAVPTPFGEMSLGQIRLNAQQRADRVNSPFVSLTEWNEYIRLAMYELYDLLIDQDPEYFTAPPAAFTCDGSTFQFPLPNGVLSFINQSGSSVVAPPFYKLMGVDLGLNTANNAFVTLDKFNFMDRNRFVYPNTAATIYGVFNLRYRLVANTLYFTPTPSAGQQIRFWYVPRLAALLKDTDVSNVSISGWIDYVIVRAAMKALTKEESDTTTLQGELALLKARIEETSINRDMGRPDTITDVRQSGSWNPGNGGFGQNGAVGGW